LRILKDKKHLLIKVISSLAFENSKQEMVMIICYLIGAKFAEYPEEIGCDENDAVDYFSALEYNAYEIIKSEINY
jgi:hypothetical protein